MLGHCTRLLVAGGLAGLVSGCLLDIDFKGTSFLCETDPTCPAGYTCIDGRCVEGGVPGSDGGAAVDDPDSGGGPAVELAFRRTLTFANGERDALDGFPVLVRLDPDRIEYDQVRADGGDIQFRDADGSTLPHEIETWNPGGVSSLWVYVPRIDGASTADHIFMYYGDPETTVAENEAAVWSAYRAVYHLDQAGTVNDSTAQAFDGTSVGATAAEGRIGQAHQFNGTDQYVNLGANRDFLTGVGSFTAEAWVAPGTLVNAGIALGISIGGADSSRAQLRVSPELIVNGGARTQDAGTLLAIDAGTLTALEWSWIAMAIDFGADTITIYQNGAQVGAAADLGFNPTTPATASLQSSIGVDENLTQNFWLGRIDEVRVATTAMSISWVSAQYASMTDQLISFGPVEAQ